ncbi:MAG: outer membrane beta-barrel protein [Burkholderiales bacterium]
MTLRLALGLAVIVPSVAAAQAWSIQSGATARGEFNDNYFFTSTNRQSAFTASVSPFVTAARRTETTDVTAVLAVGLNQVWGPSPTTDYVSGLLGLNGAVNDERSKWIGAISFVRAPSLQSAQTQSGIELVRAYTNTASVNGGYSYALTERWSVGATAAWYDNSYDAVEGGSTLSDNRGYNAGATANFRYSERTRFTGAAVFSHYASDITRNDAMTATLAVVHEFSPKLTLSAAVGGFWSDIEVTQTALVCPTTPILCDTGVAQRVPISSGQQRRDSGPLYGGGIGYAFSERTQLAVALSQNLAPGSTGTLTRTNNASAALSHRYSERLTGRLGAGYTRTSFPTGLSGSFSNTYYVGGIGASYQLAERWLLDAGYRYTRAEYSDDPSRPASNVVFISVGYNWPGTSFTDWVGTGVIPDYSPGAGPISLPERRPVPPSGESPSAPVERSPFDVFTIP